MDNKLTHFEEKMLNTIVEHTRETKDTAFGVTGHGGSRPGAGRPATGAMPNRTIRMTDDEFAKVKKFLKQLRAGQK